MYKIIFLNNHCIVPFPQLISSEPNFNYRLKSSSLQDSKTHELLPFKSSIKRIVRKSRISRMYLQPKRCPERNSSDLNSDDLTRYLASGSHSPHESKKPKRKKRPTRRTFPATKITIAAKFSTREILEKREERRGKKRIPFRENQ